MLEKVLQGLRPRAGGHYADGTLGGGGHAAAILQASSPNGWLFGCDRDGMALEAARARLACYANRCDLRRGNFEELADWIGAGTCDGVLLDLGVSSPQLDDPQRGFSFQQDGPLDMRMDTRQTLTAADLLNTASAAELARLFWELGEERRARQFARAIERARPWKTTRQLADLVERLAPRAGRRVHPATKVFQALRLAVNDELGSLKRGLEAVWTVVMPGGRLVVITFHSLEARLVKAFGNDLTRDYSFEGTVDVPELRRPRKPQARWLTRHALVPETSEVAVNPRCRSAQLRVLEKI